MYPADIDDCANSPCCQQVCANTPGGYECSCYAGYRLSPDGCACEGEHMLPGSSWVIGGRNTGVGLGPPEVDMLWASFLLRLRTLITCLL